jgi:hypothetical protein
MFLCGNSKTNLEKVIAKILGLSKFSIGLPHGQKKVSDAIAFLKYAFTYLGKT